MTRRPARRRWPSPVTLAAAAALAVVLAALLLPSALRQYYLAGLASEDLKRRESSLNWVIREASGNSRTYLQLTETLRDLPPDSAGQTYMALYRASPALSSRAVGPLLTAYAEADHDAFIRIARVLNEHEHGDHHSLLAAAGSRLNAANDDQLIELTALLDENDAWHPDYVPLEAWLRWLAPRASSPDAATRRHATTLLADARQRAAPASALDTVDALLRGAVDDPDPGVRRGAWFAAGAWSPLSETAADLFNNFDAGDDPALRRWVAAGNPSTNGPDWARVVDATEPRPFAPDSDGQALQTLWTLEHSPRISASPGQLVALTNDDPLALPPLQRILLVRAAAEPDPAWIEPVLTHDDAHLRALAGVVAGQNLHAGDRRRLIEHLAQDIDPYAKQSALLIAAYARWEGGGSLWRNRLQSLEALSESTDPATRVLASLYQEAPAGTQMGMGMGMDMGMQGWGPVRRSRAALLDRQGLPAPVVLTALLLAGDTGALDRVLGPHGLTDDDLHQLLDHHRFAWVLDTLLPPDAPRFPLWKDRDTQLEAIAHLRAWYAQRRSHWTQTLPTP